jgi:putative two-component system protein, hydrogenase maturation factor HypX/HoxX
MRILLISNSFNGFTQRVLTDLIDAGHEARVELPSGPDAMREAVDRFEPELILCPFLTQIVPKDIWTNYLVVILHPGIKGDRGPSSIDWAIMQSSREWGVTALEADEETDAGDIWSTHIFNLPLAAKSYVYRTHVIEAGMKCVFGLLDKLDGLHMRVDELVEPQEMGKREGSASSGFSTKWTAFAYAWMSFVEPEEMGKVCNSPSTLKERVIAKRRVHAKCADLLPEPLNPENRTIEGRLRPLMKQVDRKIDWQTDATEAIVRKIHAADGFPGVRDQICDRDYLLFGAHFEDILGRDSVASPGDIIATRYGAICRKTMDGAVWVSHLKRKVEGAKFFKLPATTVLPGELLAGTPETAIPPSFTGEYRTFKEI